MRGGCVALAAALLMAGPAGAAEGWKPIFNGRNLDGWVPKINHHPAGENWRTHHACSRKCSSPVVFLRLHKPWISAVSG